MLILGTDFETTGLDSEVHSITEVGMVLWDTDFSAPVKAMGYLVHNPKAVWDLKVEELYPNIKGLCEKHGYPDEKAIKQYLLWYQIADVACAHNGNRFDKKFHAAWCKFHGYDSQPNKLWIDTNTDLDLPSNVSHKLSYMAADHGFLNPFPHRAVFDVMTMMILLDKYPLERTLELARSPNLILQACVSFDDKDKAKDRGYKWQPIMKLWTMDIKECFLEKEQKEAGFTTRVIEGPVG